ncbi:hypothetical protein NRY95_11050 [Xanthomonas campestris pv. phormiicola]|nr:hypothetical protein [Xanthomonas campestris pv. phormiicola]UYC18445.1 hypothetical protein NRY95_11050 [Xanthomonas campestris pv. phormiicola]
MTTQSPPAPAGSSASLAPTPTATAPRADEQAGLGTLFPVTLLFSNIASNSNLNFTLTTAGVAWSLGARSGDSIGFSYNVTPSSADVESCIQAIEFSNSVLSIRTGAIGQAGDRADNAFTLTLYLLVAPGIDYLQGYCTLNNEAVVMAVFGAQGAVQWRNGRISAVLASHGRNHRPVSFTVKGARHGNKIDVIVTAKKGLGKVSWSLGPDFSGSSGIILASQQGQIPLTSMSYGSDTLSFTTRSVTDSSNASYNADQLLEFYLNAYLTWLPEELAYVYLRTTCNSSISVIAQVHNRQPQVVSQTDTVFTL